MLLSNKVYDAIKWIAQYLLPVTGTLYFALAAIWDLPYVEQVVGYICASILFLGGILGISSCTYLKSKANTDGTLQIDCQNPEKDIYRIQLNSPLEDLAGKKKITLIVDPNAKLSD